MDKITQLKEMLHQLPKDNFLQHALALEYIKINEYQQAYNLFDALLKMMKIILVHIIILQKCVAL